MSVGGPAWYAGWVDGWTAWQLRRGRSPKSIKTWLWALRMLGAYLVEQGVNSSSELTRYHLQGWQDRIRVRLSAISVQGCVAAARSLLQWADREEITGRPGLGVWLESPRVPERLPRPLAPEALAVILQHYSLPGAWEHLRNRALFLLFLTSAARACEVLQLRRDQFRQRQLIVRQKGGGEKALVMSGLASVWIDDYLRARASDDVPALWVVDGRRGRRPLRHRDANRIWHELARQLGVPDFTCHRLRHTGATELLEHGADVVDVAAVLGHRGLASVAGYVKVRDRRRQALVDRLDELVPPTPPDARPPRRRRKLLVVHGRRKPR